MNDELFDRGEEESRQRDMSTLLALIEYAKAEAMRLRVPTAPSLLAAAMEDIEEALVVSLEPPREQALGTVIKLPDPAARKRRKLRR